MSVPSVKKNGRRFYVTNEARRTRRGEARRERAGGWFVTRAAVTQEPQNFPQKLTSQAARKKEEQTDAG